MRIDNPISNNAIITGSFTGSFKGDGSQLTGITAEWDGSHTGDASITGDLTVGNLITAGVVDGVDVSDLKTSFDVDSAKLAGIESGATGDQTGAEIKALYEGEADTNEFSDAEKSKLAGIEAGATGDQTAAEIKSAYESNADTNEFSDAEKSKLAALEAGATGDQTGAEIKALYEAEANAFTDAQFTKLAGIEAGATGDQSAAEILTAIKTVDGAGSRLDADLLDGQSSAYYATATDVAANTSKLAGIEAGATGDQTAAEILTAIKTVDGAGSGLDADLLDGQSSAYYGTAAAVTQNTSDIADNAAAIGTINAKDPVLTVSGDASGTATFTNLGNASMTLTIADDSHNHIISNVDGLQAALDAKATPSDVTTAVNNLINGAGTAYDTLKELGDAIVANDSDIATILTTQSGKLAKASNLSDLTSVSTARTNLGLGSLATLSTVNAATITDNSVGAAELNVTGNGTTAQFLRSDGDGTFTWATPTDTNTTYSVGDGGLTQKNFTSTLKTKLDGIATSANNYSLPEATSTVRGGIELFSDTDQSVAANAVSATASRTYGIQLNSAGQAVVNVPWVDTNTNTTYSAGTGLGLSGTTFSHSDTSTQASVNNSGRTYIQDITLDGFGHVTGIASATETVVNTDTNTTYSAGRGLDLSGTQFLLETDLRDSITHIGFDSNDYVEWSNNTYIRSVVSGTERLRVDTSGIDVSGRIVADGDISAYSDERLKKDVKTIEGALDKTKALRGVEFTRIADDSKSIGVIAQELEAILPELVLTDDEGMKSVNYAQITGLLIEAVKELSAKVDELSK